MPTLSEIMARLGKKTTLENIQQAIRDANEREAEIMRELADIHNRLNGQSVPESPDLLQQLQERQKTLSEERKKIAQANAYAQRRRAELQQQQAHKKAEQALDKISPMVRKVEKLHQDYHAALNELAETDTEFALQRAHAAGKMLGQPTPHNPDTAKLPVMPIPLFERVRKILQHRQTDRNAPVYNPNAPHIWQEAAGRGINWEIEMDKRANPKKPEKDPPAIKRRESEYLSY